MIVDIADNEWRIKTNWFYEAYVNSFDPCQNLNHTYLMEEKIREMGKYSNFYQILMAVVGAVSENEIDYSKTGYASARQRCEACFLTFNKTND